MTSARKIKTLLVSGFLGAGKTSFINHLIQKLDSKKTIIIENEFGEVGIDGALLKTAGNTMFEISNGCICCDVNHELNDALREVMKVETCEYLIIETTGIADPATVAASFYSSMKIEDVFTPIHATCLVDVDMIEDRLKETDEALRQIAFATTIILNKTDLIDVEKLKEVSIIISEINPTAKVLHAEKGIIKENINYLHDFFDDNFKNLEKQPHHHHHHEHHHHEISSYTFTFHEPLKLHTLVNRLYVLQLVSSHQIYRVKGIINSVEYSEKSTIQSVGKHIEVNHIGAWDDKETKQSTIVVIGKNIEKQSIEKILNSCIVKN